MSTDDFKRAVAGATPRPKGVIVSPGLFQELDDEGLIEDKLATPGGLAAPVFGIELPFYDGDIYVACDPRIDDACGRFVLPPVTAR